MSTAIWIATGLICCGWAGFVAHEIRALSKTPAASKGKP